MELIHWPLLVLQPLDPFMVWSISIEGPDLGPIFVFLVKSVAVLLKYINSAENTPISQVAGGMP